MGAVAFPTISADDPNVVDYFSAKIFFRYPHPYLMHYGGHVVFGADRYLYVSMGDGGHQGDPDGFAQNVNVLWGKILRLDVNAKAPSLGLGEVCCPRPRRRRRAQRPCHPGSPHPS